MHMYTRKQVLLGKKLDSEFTCTDIKNLHAASNSCSIDTIPPNCYLAMRQSLREIMISSWKNYKQ